LDNTVEVICNINVIFAEVRLANELIQMFI